jgi:hypothetical protein
MLTQETRRTLASWSARQTGNWYFGKNLPEHCPARLAFPPTTTTVCTACIPRELG